ncbi:cytochrome-c peroxidase [Phnomibacter ginsenosidimutans]|uniref:Cytochrome-c peroxidase n=2 Tax=Phnomibacter ginsenosidimutans TaxID=2676868 RepID=A0A6I6GVJ1_9BACT|nr:cytochrome-c peroxidase [Phnomibacter ginsenosidimutans]
MRRWFYIASMGLLLLAGCKKNDPNAVKPVTPVSFTQPAGWPQPVYNFADNPLTEQGIALGKKLFYDGRLSKDGQFPCASCHQQDAAFGTFAHDLSHGFNNSHTLRNAPPLQNLAWYSEFHHDGGITHLDLQPLAPITNPVEMAETIDNVLNKLRADAVYRSMFTAAFGSEEINTKRMTQALSQFMLTMVSANSKYDKVMRGEATFNLPESLGYDIFKQKCASCHKEPLFTDLSYRNTGIPMDAVLQDKGRMRITQNPADSLKFRVPSLRNIMVSSYYGHDGRFFDVYQVLEHYNSGIINGPTTDPLVKNKIPLSNFEKGQLVAFLSALTDSAFLKNKKLAQP